jgi:heme/copper-type cytochrome/quinol oxidase subunit 2
MVDVGAVIWSVIRYRRRGDERSKKVGRYCGQRMQFCGLQHPNMVFGSAASQGQYRL